MREREPRKKLIVALMREFAIELIFVPIVFAAHLRGEIWMHISGGFRELDKQPMLYQNLLNTPYDIEIGK